MGKGGIKDCIKRGGTMVERRHQHWVRDTPWLDPVCLSGLKTFCPSSSVPKTRLGQQPHTCTSRKNNTRGRKLE